MPPATWIVVGLASGSGIGSVFNDLAVGASLGLSVGSIINLIQSGKGN